MKNYFDMTIPAIGVNEAFARSAVAAFALPLSPTVEQINDVKTAVSEAVTNAIVHAYDDIGKIFLHCEIDDDEGALTVTVKDEGKGICDVKAAREPFFTTRPDEERSGMGFTIMETFMDSLSVTSNLGEGTTVTMKKVIYAKS